MVNDSTITANEAKRQYTQPTVVSSDLMFLATVID